MHYIFIMTVVEPRMNDADNRVVGLLGIVCQFMVFIFYHYVTLKCVDFGQLIILHN